MGLLTSSHRNLEVSQNWELSVGIPIDVLPYLSKGSQIDIYEFVITSHFSRKEIEAH